MKKTITAMICLIMNVNASSDIELFDGKWSKARYAYKDKGNKTKKELFSTFNITITKNSFSFCLVTRFGRRIDCEDDIYKIKKEYKNNILIISSLDTNGKIIIKANLIKIDNCTLSWELLENKTDRNLFITSKLENETKKECIPSTVDVKQIHSLD